MSERTSNARGGEFATSRRPRAADHADFILTKRASGVPVSAIARMIGCNETEVALIANLSAKPADRIMEIADLESPKPARPRASRTTPRFVKDPKQTAIATWALPYIEKHASRAGVSVAAFLSKVYVKKLSAARNGCYADLYATGRCSLPQIGGWFARDHTTILSGIAKHGEAESADLTAWNRLGRKEAA